jgi:hypothetical protein
LPNDTLNADVFKMFGLNDGDFYENSIATWEEQHYYLCD